MSIIQFEPIEMSDGFWSIRVSSRCTGKVNKVDKNIQLIPYFDNFIKHTISDDKIFWCQFPEENENDNLLYYCPTNKYDEDIQDYIETYLVPGQRKFNIISLSEYINPILTILSQSEIKTK